MESKLDNCKEYFLFSQWQILSKFLTEEMNELEEEEGFSQLESGLLHVSRSGRIL